MTLRTGPLRPRDTLGNPEAHAPHRNGHSAAPQQEGSLMTAIAGAMTTRKGPMSSPERKSVSRWETAAADEREHGRHEEHGGDGHEAEIVDRRPAERRVLIVALAQA